MEAPLGIILCAGKKRETVEYLDLDVRGIHVAQYLTELPAREVLEERLRRAIEAARNRLAPSRIRHWIHAASQHQNRLIPGEKSMVYVGYH